MPLVQICKCDHEEFNHNHDPNMAWAVGESCFRCTCPAFVADNLKMLEKAIGPTVSVQKLRPPL